MSAKRSNRSFAAVCPNSSYAQETRQGELMAKSSAIFFRLRLLTRLRRMP